MTAATTVKDASSSADLKGALSRKELYDLVWETPLSRLAKRFGLSDVGLAKVCKKYSIPRPGVGYWAQVKWGQSPDKAPLPDCEDNSLEQVVFQPQRESEKGKPEPLVNDLELAKRIEYENDPANQIVVPERLKSFHPLLQGLGHPSKQDLAYMQYPVWSYTSFFCVSRNQFDRGRRMLSVLFKAAQERGHAITASEGRRKSEAEVKVLDATYYLSLREPTKRTTVPESERRYQSERTKYVPGGKLELRLGDSRNSYRQKVWRDSRKKPLESRLNEVLVALLVGVERQRAARGERERREAEFQEEQRRRREEEQKKEREQSRQQHLHKLLGAWRDAEHLREFLQRAEGHLADSGRLPSDPKWQEWLEWATHYADRLDPLALNDPLLDRAIEESQQYYPRRPR